MAPAYTLMPDHIHLLWMGTHEMKSDQRIAIEFLRQHARPLLAGHDWQRQPFDNVLRERERERGAFERVAHYIFDNPVRAGLCEAWRSYRYLGCCLPGYPAIDVRQDDYWEIFWRIYHRTIDPILATRSRSQLPEA
jgi:hypothetical protein